LWFGGGGLGVSGGNGLVSHDLGFLFGRWVFGQQTREVGWSLEDGGEGTWPAELTMLVRRKRGCSGRILRAIVGGDMLLRSRRDTIAWKILWDTNLRYVRRGVGSGFSGVLARLRAPMGGGNLPRALRR
jgi:hypothetical protein